MANERNFSAIIVLWSNFGLGNATIIETIQVQWLSGATETYSAINSNQFISITQGIGLGLNTNPETINTVLSPNPVKDFLTIKLTSEEDYTVAIFNSLGQLVLSLPQHQANESIDVSKLKPGNYILKIKSDTVNSSHKFIKI